MIFLWVKVRKFPVIKQNGRTHSIIAKAFFQHIKRFVKPFILNKSLFINQKTYLMRLIVMNKIRDAYADTSQRLLHFITFSEKFHCGFCNFLCKIRVRIHCVLSG